MDGLPFPLTTIQLPRRQHLAAPRQLRLHDLSHPDFPPRPGLPQILQPGHRAPHRIHLQCVLAARIQWQRHRDRFPGDQHSDVVHRRRLRADGGPHQRRHFDLRQDTSPGSLTWVRGRHTYKIGGRMAGKYVCRPQPFRHHRQPELQRQRDRRPLDAGAKPGRRRESAWVMRASCSAWWTMPR